jgi:ribosomal protein S18 acetylase RimI-like enzyme
MSEHFRRMIELASSVFDTRNDPEQLDVNESVMERLYKLHPATLSEEVIGDGPVCWILLIPTTEELMQDFIAARITEQELLDRTPLGAKYEAIYLCSALVLPEFRKKGIAKRLTQEAIKAIRADHPIRNLFSWNFSPEGARLAAKIAKEEQLPLLNRPRQIEL